jgi:hypothetical protein
MNPGASAFTRICEGPDEDEWDRVLEMNVKGTWLCAKATVRLRWRERSCPGG